MGSSTTHELGVRNTEAVAAALRRRARGRSYCNKVGTSCFYGPDAVCLSCGRARGWRAARRLLVNSLSAPGKAYLRNRETWIEEDLPGVTLGTSLGFPDTRLIALFVKRYEQ